MPTPVLSRTSLLVTGLVSLQAVQLLFPLHPLVWLLLGLVAALMVLLEENSETLAAHNWVSWLHVLLVGVVLTLYTLTTSVGFSGTASWWRVAWLGVGLLGLVVGAWPRSLASLLVWIPLGIILLAYQQRLAIHTDDAILGGWLLLLATALLGRWPGLIGAAAAATAIAVPALLPWAVVLVVYAFRYWGRKFSGQILMGVVVLSVAYFILGRDWGGLPVLPLYGTATGGYFWLATGLVALLSAGALVLLRRWEWNDYLFGISTLVASATVATGLLNLPILPVTFLSVGLLLAWWKPSPGTAAVDASLTSFHQ